MKTLFLIFGLLALGSMAFASSNGGERGGERGERISFGESAKCEIDGLKEAVYVRCEVESGCWEKDLCDSIELDPVQ